MRAYAAAAALAIALPTALSVVATVPAFAQVESLEVGGFQFEIETTVPVSPLEAFDYFTGDVAPWWDHSHSPKPLALVIEPKAGGSFYEVFDEEGNGAKHADVIYSHRGKRLILRGPLGLTGNATDFVFDVTFQAAEAGSTRVHLTTRAAGQMEPEWGPVVAKVWKHFLVEQYREWVIIQTR